MNALPKAALFIAVAMLFAARIPVMGTAEGCAWAALAVVVAGVLAWAHRHETPPGLIEQEFGPDKRD